MTGQGSPSVGIPNALLRHSHSRADPVRVTVPFQAGHQAGDMVEVPPIQRVYNARTFPLDASEGDRL